MRSVGRDGTLPERLLRGCLQELGLSFQTNRSDLPGSPDLVFPEARVAVFVHGCFWHRHPGCRLATFPRSNTGYWGAKFEANIERDRRKQSELGRLGWRSLVVWQCEIQQDASRVARRIARLVRSSAADGAVLDNHPHGSGPEK